ncbi:Apoptotic ATPase [Handroanthus impetiginosus]|uniref:Apoptotic ATPase n=1 Tax=Handroanthus impetiginosus TaxID=429701 RepID=A0A2G9HRA6_9LAMI|nr:Apoptotic ATPase [Handroanthus impetiginosus]
MAEAAVSFAVQTLGNLLIEKVGFLGDVEEQVEWVKRELQRMQGFLKDASEKQAKNESIRQWISEIRDLAQDAEDVIETFILEIDNPRRSRGLLGRCASFPSHLYHLNKLGNEIKSIKARLEEIIKSREAYKIENIQGSFRRSYTAEQRKLSPWQRNKHLVGLDEDVKLLLQKAVLEKKKGLSIASIVGMGGIGKSTLARAVYNHAEVAHQFDRRAWVVVSQQFNLAETIQELVLQLEPNENKQHVLEIMKNSPEQHLKSMLHERLKGRRYFIVVDDVWRQQDWELLASAFPDEQDKASRLLVTSRSHNIPRRAQYVHEMKTLDNDRSWELLLKTAFNDSNNIGTCPHELEDIGREILTKCKGLPLAITVVGGLLLEQRQSRAGWEKVLQEINSHSGRNRCSSIEAILELSYHDLPPHLKSCFLCLGFFKEDATIHADKVVHIWVAEGLIPQEGVNTMEDTSRDYLDELINRNMVQVKDLSRKDGRVKNCQIHDLLRELSIKKAKEEINFEILKDQGNSILQSLGHKPRHCAISCSTESFNIFSTRSVNKHLRSLFFHGGGGGDVNSRSSYNWKSFRLLRVLDMEGLGLRKLSDTIGELVGLRYLGLRYNDLEELPSSLSRLKNLQVLDLLGNRRVKVPNVIWKIDSLHHIYIFEIDSKVPLKKDTLKNLQTLKYITARTLMLGHPTQMTSLRKLGILLNFDSDVNEICTSLATLENLVYLDFTVHNPESRIQSLDGLVYLRHLTELKVIGEVIKFPGASDFPPNLSSLTLRWTELKEDPMPILEKLPKLLYLKLMGGSYAGKKMVVSHEGFPSLKVLHLEWLGKLRNIKVETGGMSELKQLGIYYCPDLERLPEELKFMSNLQELKLCIFASKASTFQDVNSHIISSIPSVNVELTRQWSR